jgi:hypothetical protein
MRLRCLLWFFVVGMLGGLASSIAAHYVLPPQACQSSSWVTEEDVKQLEQLFGGRHGTR